MSSAPRYLVDANILLRFLAGEPIEHAEAAGNLFARAGAGEIVLDISPVIVAEVFYVMTAYYEAPQPVAAERLSLMLQRRGIQLREANQVLAALKLLQTTNVDFADAYLAACAVEENAAVASFDRDFDKFKGVRRHEPKR